jgi:hypothetical protein
MTRTGFTVADLPELVRRGRITQADAERVTGKQATPAAQTVRKVTAQVRAEANAALETEAQDLLTRQLADLGIPSPRWDRVGDRQTFSGAGNWRFDGRLDERMIAIEIEGGTNRKSRHTSPLGYERDCTKYNEGQVLGWIVLRFTYAMIRDGRAVDTIARAWKARKPLDSAAR